MENKMDPNSIILFANDLFSEIWHRHGLSYNGISCNEMMNDHFYQQRVETVTSAVICQQHIYRVLFKEFFIRNFPDFILTKMLFRTFIEKMCNQICTYEHYDFYEYFWNSCAFVAEMHMFCLSRALKVNLKEVPVLWTKSFLKVDCNGNTWEELEKQSTHRYKDLYNYLMPYMMPKTPYRTILVIDNAHKMLRNRSITQNFKFTTLDINVSDIPPTKLQLMKELCVALLATGDLISTLQLELLNEIEVHPPISENSYAALDFVLFSSSFNGNEITDGTSDTHLGIKSSGDPEEKLPRRITRKQEKGRTSNKSSSKTELTGKFSSTAKSETSEKISESSKTKKSKTQSGDISRATRSKTQSDDKTKTVKPKAKSGGKNETAKPKTRSDDKAKSTKPKSDDEAKSTKPKSDDEAKSTKPKSDDEAKSTKQKSDDEAKSTKPKSDDKAKSTRLKTKSADKTKTAKPKTISDDETTKTAKPKTRSSDKNKSVKPKTLSGDKTKTPETKTQSGGRAKTTKTKSGDKDKPKSRKG